jgi:hypothetical protein
MTPSRAIDSGSPDGAKKGDRWSSCVGSSADRSVNNSESMAFFNLQLLLLLGRLNLAIVIFDAIKPFLFSVGLFEDFCNCNKSLTSDNGRRLYHSFKQHILWQSLDVVNIFGRSRWHVTFRLTIIAVGSDYLWEVTG